MKIPTLSESEVTQLHVGLKGTMNALFLKDLANKTRRSLRGPVKRAARRSSAPRLSSRVDRDLGRPVKMIPRGGAADRLNAKMLSIEQRKRDLEATSRRRYLHPEIANFYRPRLYGLHELLQHGPEAARLKAADMLSAFIPAIVLTERP